MSSSAGVAVNAVSAKTSNGSPAADTLADDANQPCEAIDRIARVHLAEIDRKIADLSALRFELDRVIGSCRHGTVADCKIIETLGPRIS